jgi:hypothetical protein
LGALEGGTLASVSCGTDVDLGGTTDSGGLEGAADAPPDAALDAPPLALSPCDPCQTINDCGDGATCALIGGPNGFCALLCAAGGGCGDASDDASPVCAAEMTVMGAPVQACVPGSGTCAPATEPDAGADGSVPTRCGDLVAPSVSGTPCHSCTPNTSDCQPNGCYGGWWCNTYYRRCDRPPKYCP